MASELIDVIKGGDVEKLKAGIENSTFKPFLHKSICDGDFPLHLAAKARNEKMVKLILEAGANVNQGSEVIGSHRGYTAAHEAAGNGDIDILSVLSDFNADFNRCSDDQWYPLHCAVYKGKQGAISFLLENGANVNCETVHHQTPLCFAVSHGRLRDIRLLLKNNAKIELNDSNQDSLMHHALHYRMSKLFEGEYEIPESQLDVAVVLSLHGVNPQTLNNEREEAMLYIQEDIPSFSKVLRLLYNNALQLKSIPIEWNYMSILSSKEESLVAVGLTPNDAHELTDAIAKADKEREESKARRLAERPQGGCPVMRGKRKTTGNATANVPNAADPSGGKCPFFQKKDGQGDASTTALPAGHPPIPSDIPNASAGDPSGGKCPFFQKKADPSIPGNPAAYKNELPPVCPFSIAFVQRHATVFLLVGFSFVLGMWVDQMLNRFTGH